MSPSCSFRSGGSLLSGACRRRGSSAGRTRRRRCHWTTHRSSSMRALGVSVVASWRLSRWSLTSRLLSSSRSSHETTPTLRHHRRYYSPRFSGSGTVSFDYFFIFFSSSYYRIRVYVCTCFLVLLVSHCQSFHPKRHSFVYKVKYPPHSGSSQGISSIQHMLCKSRLGVPCPPPASVPLIAIAVPPRLTCPSSSSIIIHCPSSYLPTVQCLPLVLGQIFLFS